jgi:hypothetical protein
MWTPGVWPWTLCVMATSEVVPRGIHTFVWPTSLKCGRTLWLESNSQNTRLGKSDRISLPRSVLWLEYSLQMGPPLRSVKRCDLEEMTDHLITWWANAAIAGTGSWLKKLEPSLLSALLCHHAAQSPATDEGLNCESNKLFFVILPVCGILL